MRLLLILFGFLALAIAPFATPATAMAASNSCSAEMVSHDGGHGQMPSDMKAHADLCCMSVASALPATSETIAAPTEAKSLIDASPVTKLSGIQPAATDPPPRA
jgi:DNA-binding transcriptional regulator LsrR (DeoR family)